VTFTITWNDGILESKTQGDATFDGLAGMTSALLSHEKSMPGGTVLVDHSDLKADSLKLGEIRSLAEMTAQARTQIGRARIAHVVSRDLEFGLVRMWENFASPHTDARLGCFRSRDHAIAWLMSLS